MTQKARNQTRRLQVISHRLKVVRPKTRRDCASVPRPCPFVACRHNLYLEVNRTGTAKLNFPALEPCEMGESCSLDVAETGARSLSEVGELLGVSRERVHQVETVALAKLRKRGGLVRFYEDED